MYFKHVRHSVEESKKHRFDQEKEIQKHKKQLKEDPKFEAKPEIAKGDTSLPRNFQETDAGLGKQKSKISTQDDIRNPAVNLLLLLLERSLLPKQDNSLLKQSLTAAKKITSELEKSRQP
jgi:hypothetical protein